MKKKIIILGGGGHAGIIYDCIKAQKKFHIIGYIDRKPSLLSKEKIKYLGSESTFLKNLKKIKICFLQLQWEITIKEKKFLIILTN